MMWVEQYVTWAATADGGNLNRSQALKKWEDLQKPENEPITDEKGWLTLPILPLPGPSPFVILVKHPGPPPPPQRAQGSRNATCGFLKWAG